MLNGTEVCDSNLAGQFWVAKQKNIKQLFLNKIEWKRGHLPASPAWNIRERTFTDIFKPLRNNTIHKHQPKR